MKLPAIACLSIVVLSASACVEYRYGDAKYASREEAVQAIRAETDAAVAGVVPVSERLGGRALIAVPTRTVIEAHGVRKGGAAGGDMVGYVVDATEIGILGLVEGVRKGEVFDETTLLRHDAPGDAVFDAYDYKLWLFSDSPDTWQWYLSRRGVARREPVSLDSGLEDAERLDSFNRAIVRAGE